MWASFQCHPKYIISEMQREIEEKAIVETKAKIRVIWPQAHKCQDSH